MKNCYGLSSLAVLSLSSLSAAGFQLLEQNATFLGQAYSGTASSTENASLSYYNSAATLRLRKGHHFSGSLDIIAPKAKYEVKESLRNFVLDVEGSDTYGKLESINPIPQFFYAYKYSSNWAFSCALVAPFGLSTDYPKDSKLRFLGIESSLQALGLMPAATYGNDLISVSAGPIIAEAKIHLSSAMTLTGSDEYLLEQNTKSFNYGWHFGVHAQGDDIAIGLSFKSSLNIKSSGTVTTDMPTGTRYVNIEAKSPWYTNLSLHYKILPKLTVTTEWGSTGWSNFDYLNIYLYKRFKQGNPTHVSIAERFSDTNRYAVGINYDYLDQWLIRFGFAHDQTPTNNQYRNIRIPDSSRNWYCSGVTKKTSFGSIDTGYAFVKMKDATVNEMSDTGLFSAKVDYKSYVHILGIQWNYIWS